jgi:hypothetical protein
VQSLTELGAETAATEQFAGGKPSKLAMATSGDCAPCRIITARAVSAVDFSTDTLPAAVTALHQAAEAAVVSAAAAALMATSRE